MNYEQWLQETVEKIKKKELAVVTRNPDSIPYRTDENGHFRNTNPCWWTNGFWGGILWQLHHTTGEQKYADAANRLEKRMDENLWTSFKMDHDSGFKWLPTSVLNYRLNGSEESKNRAMLAADNLAGRFNPVGKFIRAWNGGDYPTERLGWAIIDCMMNLPLLYWAADQTGDPRYVHIATMHADTTMKNFVRGDGSVAHICMFDPYTGEYLGSRGGQGYGEGSSWTRGQAWAIYGFTLSYIHTKKPEYLDCAKRVANYFIANIPEDGLIPVDFRQPADIHREDNSAAVIAACGLIELARLCDGADGALYHKAAVRMLQTVTEKRVDWSVDTDALVLNCAGSYHNLYDISLIYADYYLIEAIWKLNGTDLFIW